MGEVKMGRSGVKCSEVEWRS